MTGMAVVGGVFMVLAMLAVIALVVWAFVTLISIGRQTKKNTEDTAAILALLRAHVGVPSTAPVVAAVAPDTPITMETTKPPESA